jgi:RNA polymerase sigma-70 factor (ECF subfamily)
MRARERQASDEDSPGHDVPALVWRAQDGDRDAFACLAAEHQPALVRFCRRLMGDTAGAEDLAQETLLRAQASLARLGEPYRFGPWLLGIAANLARKWWRVQARSPLSLDSLISAYPNVAWDESLAAVASPEELEEQAEQMQHLIDAIAALPAALSRVVVLHYLHGLNYAEVAAALDVPVSTVKGRLFKSRARLRSDLLAASAGQPMQTQPRAAERRTRDRKDGKDNRMDEIGRWNAERKAQQRRLPSILDSRAPGTINRRPRLHPMTSTGWPLPSDTDAEAVPRHIRIEVNRDALVDEVVAYVSAPGSADNRRRALNELASKRNLWFPRDLLYQMVLDGVTRRKDVEALIDFTIAEHDLIARRAGTTSGA